MDNIKEGLGDQEKPQKRGRGRPKGVTKEVMLKRIAENNPYRRLKQSYASVSSAENSIQGSASETSHLQQGSLNVAKNPSDAQMLQENQSQQTTGTISSPSSKVREKKSLVLCNRTYCMRWYKGGCIIQDCERRL